MIRHCRDSRDFIPIIKDNADGSRTQQLSNCLEPCVTVDAPATNPAPAAPKDNNDSK